MKRRHVIEAMGITGVAGLSGCLRLSRRSDQTTAQPATSSAGTSESSNDATETTSAETTSTPENVELEPRKQLSEPVSHGFNYDGDFYIGSYDSITRMSTDGSTAWGVDELEAEYNTNNTVAFSPSTVFWGLRADDETEQPLGGKVIALDRRTGDRQWSFETETDGMHHNISSLAAVSSDLLVAGSDDTGMGDKQEPLVYGLDPSNGNQLWKTGEFPASFIETVFAYNGSPYVVLLDGIYRCDPSTGRVTTVRESYSGFGRSTLAGNNLYLPGSPLQSFNLDREQVRWKAQVTGTVKAQPVVSDGRVFAGTDTGFVYGFDTANGEKTWERRVLSQVHDMATTPNVVWVTDDTGALYGFSRQDGTKVFEQKSTNGGGQPVSAVGRTLLSGGGRDSGRLLQVPN